MGSWNRPVGNADQQGLWHKLISGLATADFQYCHSPHGLQFQELLDDMPIRTPPTERMPDNYFVSWKKQYNVHIDAIDRQHQALVDLIRQLQEAMWEGRGRAFQDTLIDRLVAYTKGHLRFEEDMLSKRGYESLAEHVEQHRTLTSQVYELKQKIHDGEPVSNASLVLFLRNWLTDHIMQHDQKYARALRIKT